MPVTAPGNSLGDGIPSVSPDGSVLAFRRRTEAAVEDVWIQTLGATSAEATRLTHLNNVVQGIAWTDSRALLASLHDGRARELCRIHIPGGRLEPVIVPSYRPSFPAVARNSNRLVYVTRYFDSNLWRGEIDEEAPAKEFAKSKELDSSPSISPSGKWIVFRSSRTGTDDIWVAGIDGGDVRRLTNMDGPITGSPRWSPDSFEVAFDSRPGGKA